MEAGRHLTELELPIFFNLHFRRKRTSFVKFRAPVDFLPSFRQKAIGISYREEIEAIRGLPTADYFIRTDVVQKKNSGVQKNSENAVSSNQNVAAGCSHNALHASRLAYNDGQRQVAVCMLALAL